MNAKFVAATALAALLAGCGNGGIEGGSAGSSATGGGASGGSSAAAGATAAGGATSAAGTSASGGGSGAAGKAGSSSGASAGSAGTGVIESPSDWVGVVGTGQSLSQGWESTAISTTQQFSNLKLRDDGPDPKYPVTDSATAVWSAIPLTEPIRMDVPGYDLGPYPDNVWRYGDSYGETPHSGMANAISALWQARGAGDYVTAHTVVGYGGAGVKDISKGVHGYLAALNEAQVFMTLAAAAGKTYSVGGIILTHGEADSHNPGYGAALYQLWQDYNTDLKAVTGQTRDVVMLGSQQSSNPSGWDDGYGSAVQLWQAGVDHPGQVVCTGPKYQFGAYGLHMNGPSYERMGEKYGEVFDAIVNQKIDWKPLGPNHASRSGAVITIEFDVPNPPLSWDDNLAKPHQVAHTAWANGRGFEVIDAAKNELTISSVEIVDSSVVITLSQAPAADAALTVGYGLTQDTADAYQGGTDLGPHGQLRDSDDFAGYDIETIEVNVTNGSSNISVGTGGFSHRAKFDWVSGGDLPDGTLAASILWDGMTLSQPWPGATGKAMLTFRHNHNNYCVHFALAVQ